LSLFRLVGVAVILVVLVAQVDTVKPVLAEPVGEASVSWEPLRVKVEGKILPGDILRISLKAPVSQLSGKLELGYTIACESRGKLEAISWGLVEARAVEGAWLAAFNLTVPWCSTIVVEIVSTDGTLKESLKLNVDPEVSVSLPDAVKFRIEERREGGVLILKVIVRSTVDGEVGRVTVIDETLGMKIAERQIPLSSGIRVEELYIKLPENPVRLFILKDVRLLHKISVRYEGIDTYEGNNEDSFYVVIFSEDVWRIPWAITVTLGLAALLAALIYIARKVYL